MRGRSCIRSRGFLCSRRSLAVLALAWMEIALAVPRDAEAQTVSAGIASRLVDRISAGDPDSARGLIRTYRGLVPEVLESLLADRAEHSLANHLDSAAIALDAARSIAALYTNQFADSFCLRMVGHQESIPSENLPADAAGWREVRAVRRLLQAGNWPEARARLPAMIQLAQDSADPYLEERAHRLAGNCLQTVSSLDEARAEYEKAVELARRLDDRTGESRILSNVALTFQNQGRVEEAIVILRVVLEAARGLGDLELQANAHNNIGINFKSRGTLDSARASFEEGLAVTRAAGLQSFHAAILTNLGDVLAAMGEYEQGIQCEKEALRISHELGLGTKKQELSAGIFLGGLYGNLERYSEALVALSEALEVAQGTGAIAEIATLRLQMGEICRLMGRPEEATAHYQEALPAVREAGVPWQQQDLLHFLGLALLEAGRIDEAMNTWEEALRLAERHENRFGRATALGDLAHVRQLRGQPEEAESLLLRALAVADTLGNPLIEAGLELELGSVLAARGGADRAIALFDRAMERGAPLGATAVVREALVGKADVLRHRGELAAADSLLSEAIGLVESVRARQSGEEIRLGFLAGKKAAYVARVGVLHARATEDLGGNAHIEEAFRVAERARARSLLDVVSARGLDPGDAVAPALRERERRLAARLGAIQTELSRLAAQEAWDAAGIDSLERLHRETARQYRSALDEISARSPAYAALSGHRDPLTVGDVRRRVLAPGQVLIEYLVGDGESFVFLVTPDRLRCERLPVGADTLAGYGGRLRAALGLDPREPTDIGGEAGSPAEETLATLATDLYSLLLAPLADEIPEGARLLIVPDGPLFYLPFALLRRDGQFLVERHAIAYAPSASVIDPSSRVAPRPSGRSLIAVGNPASFRGEFLLASARDPTRWRFGELPYAAEEVRRVSSHFRHATALVGGAATEEAVKSTVTRASYIHFATHGVVNEGEPLLSGLALAQDEDPSEDGLLQAHEILRLRVPADLVVLSACNTGLGRIAGGEGVLGLTRAFLHAGARALVISLWEVGDRSTADLMDTFYRAHVDEGLPTDEALQAAQIASLSAGRPPREWAPFALVGSAAPPNRGDRARARSFAIALLTGLALLAFAVLAVRAERAGTR